MLFAQTEDETGFTTLFDGRSLDGWTVQDGPESAFYVNDGAIVAHESAGIRHGSVPRANTKTSISAASSLSAAG